VDVPALFCFHAEVTMAHKTTVGGTNLHQYFACCKCEPLDQKDSEVGFKSVQLKGLWGSRAHGTADELDDEAELAAFCEMLDRQEHKTKGSSPRDSKHKLDDMSLAIRNGKDVLLDTGAVYSGEWHTGQRHGYGLLKWPDGGIYEGQFNEGWASGKGRFTHANGDVYVGEWVNDRAHGHGKFLHKDGDSFVGQWQADMKSGHGVETWGDGASYAGGYKSGRKHGPGKYCGPDASSYSGQFCDDNMDGYGTYSLLMAEFSKANGPKAL